MSVRGARFLEGYEEIKVRGSGSFGTVIEARHKLDQTLSAVKEIRRQNADGSDLMEVQNLAKLKHRNIVDYKFSFLDTPARAPSATVTAGTALGPASADPSKEVVQTRSAPISVHDGKTGISPMSVQDGSSADSAAAAASLMPMEVDDHSITAGDRQQQDLLYIVMELCDSSLEEYLRVNCIKQDQAWTIVQQLVEALIYLKEKHVVHGDIKPANILLTEDATLSAGSFRYVVKLGDFGLTTVYGNMMRGRTPLYSSPEQGAGEACSPKSDVYSLGLVLLQLLCPGLSHEMTAKLLENARAGAFPKRVEQCEKTLLAGMLQRDLERRNDVTAVKEHIESFHKNKGRPSASLTGPL